MDITLVKDQTFKLKGKTGFALTDPNGLTLESITGENSKVFKGPGEYEVAGISVIGIKVEENTIFIYEVDGLRICHLGSITKKLSDNKVSAVGDVNVLLVPVTDQSVEMTQQIEADYVIPYGYKSEEELDKFLKETGLVVERMSKFNLKKEDLIEDSTAQIVVLENK